ncbi:MAG: helix-turn-helix domain-containing protein [Candidatus Aminicenantales bacterium]
MDERQRREKAIRRYEKGESPKDIYNDLKRSESWFFKWLKRYRKDGDDWAQDRS